MPLIFPSNPTVNQTYQSGSTATYQWDGTKWTVVQPASTTVVTARSATSASVATSASFSTNATSASFATSATSATTAVSSSALSGSVPTYIYAQNNSQQSIPYNSLTTITNWTNSVTQNAAEWNATTGVFTATKPGTYSVSAALTYANASGNQGAEYNISIYKSGVLIANGWQFVQGQATYIRPIQMVTALATLAVGDTITFRAFQTLNGSAVALIDRITANLAIIQELPSRIQR